MTDPSSADTIEGRLLQVADKVGGFSGLLDFGDIANGRVRFDETVGKNIGVGVDYTKQIIHGVGDDFGPGRRECGVFTVVETEFHVRILSKVGLRFFLGDQGEDSIVNGLGGEVLEGEAAGGSRTEGLGIQFLNGRIKEGKDGKRGVVRAEFLDGA